MKAIEPIAFWCTQGFKDMKINFSCLYLSVFNFSFTKWSREQIGLTKKVLIVIYVHNVAA